MNRLLLIALLLFTLTASAACTVNTVFIDGKIVTCETCCHGTNCTTTCL